MTSSVLIEQLMHVIQPYLDSLNEKIRSLEAQLAEKVRA